MRILAILNEIKSFRLGYTEEQPYPWRWTSPVVLCAFLLISPFLALVNVPLSAYNIIQEFTYHPNNTRPAVFLANIVPSVLQNPTDSFTPHLLNVGDPIALDHYIFNYTISQALDGVDKTNPVPAFPYFNNPFSDGCDVANTTVQLLFRDLPDDGWSLTQVQVSGTVACYLPTPFYLTWDAWPELDERGIRSVPTSMNVDIGIPSSKNFSIPGQLFLAISATFKLLVSTSLSIHAANAFLAGGPLEDAASLLESPCSSNPAQFVVVANQLSVVADQVTYTYLAPVSLPAQIADLLTGGSLGNVSISALSTAYGNLIQTLYHLVRLDLGVILENQIYNSPEMFNRSISPLDLGFDWGSWANTARDWTSNATLMAEWQQDVKFFQNNTRVPPLEYLRSVSRLKPLGSAMTSVFVSTFAMLSVM
ncbi:hypothetical protein MSAN_02305100 [Mycena sanguinolenta]|uniref:Uncharacterized protein n=1 Tax=Mycena sanguinolenta TaxID=230812 RepID=A0A8H7CG81_9AGAR|nr:hypothetical protein MSAN_02305100 [Mycena sanguinolenta]